ncbi:YlzJ-like family protein [Niallia endozanthoxylica]|uniref:Ribonuclease n=1 Tax=Niallia endozanthoxylica TaxID=2036016 RepID=A0A5J5HTF7_9BACI|nr:YlzJ-like family protein [Niallia endozanthoxylica]KAA9025819.1 ribonuclease [Niallia endozanthoxylica]
MILYTTMPQELVYQTQESEYAKQKVIDFEGIPLLVEMNENHDYRVLQVMSSDPSHYMDNRFCPGAILSNKKYS